MTEQTFPSLADVVHIHQAAIRTIRLDSDLLVPGITPSYVLTAQARTSLGRILSGLESNHVARAWTLTGPYGSGKSYFGLFLMNLLGKTQPDHVAALRVLVQLDEVLAHQVQGKYLDSSQGFLPVPITGYRAPLQECLREGLLRAVQRLGIEQAATNETLVPAAQASSRAFVLAFSALLEQAVRQGYCGVLLIIDELGKLLEFAATHPDTTDIYLLQEIAEIANRSADTPLVVIGILHQAFERYAAFLDSVTQQEWAKVQGRFEDIPFQEPPTQQLHLLARALTHERGLLETIKPMVHACLPRVLAAGWCPPMMGEDTFSKLALQAYPLHPTAFVALPLIFRRLAQNERSIFAYLTSHEPKGFQEFLQQYQAPAFIRLIDLFDYVAANFQGRLYASGRGRILAETLDRLNSLSTLSALESALLKSIGLLNWLGETSHLQPTEEALIAALDGDYHEAEVRETLQALQQRSLIVYRRFNRTYVIWQGSDVDIEDRLRHAYQHLSRIFSPATMLQKYLPPRPLVARRHSYRTGTTRAFDVRYADAHSDYEALLSKPAEASGLVVLCIPSTTGNEQSFVDWAHNPDVTTRTDVVIGIAQPAPRLLELLYELLALQWVYEHTPELRDDTVARREWRARRNDVEMFIQQHLETAFGLQHLAQAVTCRWYHRGQEVTSQVGKNLTAFLSVVCDDLYEATPRLWNELINRRQLSSQAAAARRNLIEAMLTYPYQPTLGISGYPPERSMYESLLRESGLHRQDETGQWYFAPPPFDDPLGLGPVWDAIATYVFAPPMSIRPLQELFERLKAPPYGLTDGVLPVLLCAFYLVHQHEMTLYREGTLLPEPGIADWEVLLRRPELFALAGCRLEGIHQVILERLARSLSVEVAVMPVVRELLRRLKMLPEHAWRTQRLPEQALRLRRVIERARSPEQLLFVELPEALELAPFDKAQDALPVTDEFFRRLNEALLALSEATPRLRTWARDQLLGACKLPEGEAGWEQFLTLAESLVQVTTNPRLLPLLQRAVGAPDPASALDSVLAFVGGRPVRVWTDSDADRFMGQARAMGALFVAERNDLAGEALLTPEEQKISAELAERLHGILQPYYNENRRVALATLRLLLRDRRFNS
jgi:hypothetical protein